LPDGAWMVELAGLSDPALVPDALARSLGVPLPGRAPVQDELVAGIAQRSLLLVLDNCEHLLDAVAALVLAIAQGAPGIALLATSQEPLRLAFEQQYRLAPLAVPADTTERGVGQFGAVALFEARVRAANPRFVLSEENIAMVVDICRRLDGLPLAIELAAARVAALGLRPVRDKLDARFRLLTGGTRATLRRHQTLRAALEWSYNLLNDEERALFRRLGVFAGGFTMDLAQAVAADERLDEWAVLDHLSALVDKSLVVADAGHTPRYRLLESARAYALEQLAAGETADMLARHAHAMRRFLERVDDANLDGELRTDQYAARVVPELDNLRAAHAWAQGEGGDPELATALAVHAGSLIDYASECVDWILSARESVEGGAVGDALAARYWRAIAASNLTGHVPRALQIEATLRARSLYEALGLPRRVFTSLIQLAAHRVFEQDVVAAQRAADDARRLVRPDWPVGLRIPLLRIDGYIAHLSGRIPEALAYYRDSVRVTAAAGDWRLEVLARSNLADILWHVGPIEDAAKEVCGLAEELRLRPAAAADMALANANLLGILSETGRIDEASAVAGEALSHMRRAGSFFLEEWTYLFWRRGQVETAVELLGAVDAERVRSGLPMQKNEQRLIAAARPALEAQLPPDAFARHFAAGAALSKAEVVALIARAID
jgi:predicted ATPase